MFVASGGAPEFKRGGNCE